MEDASSSLRASRPLAQSLESAQMRSEDSPSLPATTFSPLKPSHSPNGHASDAGNRDEIAPKSPATATIKFSNKTEGFPFQQSGQEGHHGMPMDSQRDSDLTSQPLSNGVPRVSRFRRASDGTTLPNDNHSGEQSPHNGGSATPAGRRSVQFVRPTSFADQALPARSRSGSVDADADDTAGKGRGASLFSKIRAFAGSSSTPSHTRSPSGYTIGGDSIHERSDAEHAVLGQQFERMSEEPENVLDADGENSTGEDKDGPLVDRKRRRKSRRPGSGAQTAPTTPKAQTMRDIRPVLQSSNSGAASESSNTNRPIFFPRRATMTDVARESRQGVSEDEGRDILDRESPWRRGSAWVHGPRGSTYGGARKPNHRVGESPRPSTFRRFTGFGNQSDAAEASPISPWRIRGDRSSSISAAKWRQLKAGLKMIGQRRKAESTPDHVKSAELLAELTAGVPAALILASMFQRDEHGNKKIPVLLEQLKVRITDSEQVEKSGDRHLQFRIELEYGNGLTRMKWVIHRFLRDFANLHARYKLQIGAQKYIQLKGNDARTKLPHFPRSAFPYLRGIRGLDSESEEDEDEADGTGPSGGDASGTDRPKRKKRRRPSMSVMRRKSSTVDPGDSSGGAIISAGAVAGALGSGIVRKDPYAERQRRKLELYLQQMIRYLIFRPESNRLCKFLELSALGVRLAAEGTYHGKEGLLIIQSGKGTDFRRAWTPSLIKGRHGPKWFLVRHSYIVVVDSPEEMNIYDVFLADSTFQIQPKKRRLRDQKAKDLARSAKESAAHPQHHTLRLINSERKMKLLAKNERQLGQFEESIRKMTEMTPWVQRNRFESFAPPRPKVFAQWLVDGRDYMWNVSRAISMAKDVVYIHDWWLSPELYMRRPAAISQKWRLDRLLQRKAQEGVKIFVIMYRNINSAIPIDSEYSKFSLLDLHPNVFVQRSPNQIRQNTFFWAHHEKICVVDHMVAFVGGIDLCFGRWDSPQHSVIDDKLTGFEESDMPKDADHCQLWPGKDYSNPRVQDFYALDKPYEEMYDRSKVPRMPWHDISMQVVGQPARDLTRHFVQRWNFILRQRKPTRPTPFLLPPPDFQKADLEALGLDGTCEVQILRSCCEWSMGTPGKVEHSIMNAYIKMIEQSEYFVYVENQFFISSTEVEGTRIENTIGDALVERIVRASQNGEDWRAVIVIPLMPGFQNTVDSQDGTSVRLIMQCQFRSICRGDASIFGRLRSQNIIPEDFIQFYSLRSWGKIGPSKQLVTEQLYIHAKCMIVDDRIAIIGSANINERSMLGTRDSECAAVVRDTDMLWSTMNGEPYQVGRFPHTLRMRLMREHLGLDVDQIMENERQEDAARSDERFEQDMDAFHGVDGASDVSTADLEVEQQKALVQREVQENIVAKTENLSSFNHDVDWEQAQNPNLKTNKKATADVRVTGNEEHHKDVAGDGADQMKAGETARVSQGRDTTLKQGHEILLSSNALEGKEGVASLSEKKESPQQSPARGIEELGNLALPPEPGLLRLTSTQLGLPTLSTLPALPKTDDTDIGGPAIYRKFSYHLTDVMNPLIADMKRPYIDKDCMKDPLNDSFFHDIWHAVAENNTKLYRHAFRCMPDNEVKTWKEYKEYAAYSERFMQAQGGGKPKDRVPHEVHSTSGPPGQPSTHDKLRLLGPLGEIAGGLATDSEKMSEKIMHTVSEKNHNNNQSMGEVEQWAEDANKEQAERQAREGLRIDVPNHGSPIAEETTLDEKASLRSPIDNNLQSLTLSQETMNPGISLDSQNLLHKNTTIAPSATNNSANTTNPQIAPPTTSTTTGPAPVLKEASQKRRRRAPTRGSKREFRASDDMVSPTDAEEMLRHVQGHLVVWPYDWLQREEMGGNWLYSIDQLAPLEI
ncbi:Phospholipase D1 [Bachmanniomyces sp. S44760]|nr:Phospholipase D1 [Bachmanniomyces sp. S44760]